MAMKRQVLLLICLFSIKMLDHVVRVGGKPSIIVIFKLKLEQHNF